MVYHLKWSGPMHVPMGHCSVSQKGYNDCCQDNPQISRMMTAVIVINALSMSTVIGAQASTQAELGIDEERAFSSGPHWRLIMAFVVHVNLCREPAKGTYVYIYIYLH